MGPIRQKLEEMMHRNFNKDDYHKLTMELFEHHTYAKESAYVEGYRAAVNEIQIALVETPVKEFHEKFNHPIRLTPTVPTTSERLLRVKLVMEEALEFASASGVDVCVGHDLGVNSLLDGLCELLFDEADPSFVNVVEAADSLGDLRYVTDGANLTWGFPQEEILYEIHRSNLTKLGKNGLPIYRKDGKVEKGPDYDKPHIKEILIEKGWSEDE